METQTCAGVFTYIGMFASGWVLGSLVWNFIIKPILDK